MIAGLLPDRRFPWDMTTLVGRNQEGAAVTALLGDQSCRLLVLTGPGGVGKTRLALHVARQLVPDTFDRLSFVALSMVREAALVAPAIASALAAEPGPDETVFDAIVTALQPGRNLLLVDNFEQVIDAAPLLTSLLQRCGNLTILVTSRAELQVYGERVYPVPPLAVPAAVVPEDVEGDDDLLQSESVQLLVARAREADPHFTVTGANAAAVAAICRRLDGLPLAIELAAAHLGSFSPAALAARLDQSLGILSEQPADADLAIATGFNGFGPRRTIQSAIAWSYDLLSPGEQAVLRRLGVFLGAWDLADAAALTGIDLAGSPAFDESVTADIIGSLVAKSLVRAVEGATAGSHFRLLQAVREFCLERLRDRGELAAVRAAHHAWLLHVAETAAPQLTGHRQTEWLNQLQDRHADFRAAFRLLLRQTDPTVALRLAKALWRFGYTRGHIREMREMLDQALARAPEPTILRAEALTGVGFLANLEGRVDAARSAHEEARAIAIALGDDQIHGEALLGLGGVAVERGENGLAQQLYRAAVTRFTAVGNLRGLAVASTNLGNVHQVLGQLPQARQAHEEAQHRYTDLGDVRGIAWSQTNLGHVLTETANYPAAIRQFLDALRGYTGLGDVGGIIEVLEALARIGARMGDPEHTATLLGAAAVLRERIHAPIATQELERHEAAVGAARAALGDAAYNVAFRQGEMLPDEEMRYMATAAAHAWLRQVTPPAPPPKPVAEPVPYGLTGRELDVLRHLAAGKSNQEIADTLAISVRTVGTHVSNILGKLEVPSRAAAVALVTREGILP